MSQQKYFYSLTTPGEDEMEDSGAPCALINLLPSSLSAGSV